MSNCEFCNKEGELKKCILNGSVLELCEFCIDNENAVIIKPDYVDPIIDNLKKEEDQEMIVFNYSEIIKKAREKKGLTQGDLARSISEPVKIIEDLEKNTKIPSFLLAKKLNNKLDINIIVSYKSLYPTKDKIDFKNSNLRIKDILKSKDLK